MVITGLTRNQFVLTDTRVRIPPSPPKEKGHRRVSFFSLARAWQELSFCAAKQGLQPRRKPSGSLITSGSAKNSRVCEYPLCFYMKSQFCENFCCVGIGLDLWHYLFYIAVCVNYKRSAYDSEACLAVQLLFLPHAVGVDGGKLRV